MAIDRREFLQFAAVAAAVPAIGTSPTRVAAQQTLTQDDLLQFDSKGQVTLLHFTDVHAQLKPVYFRPPGTNIGAATPVSVRRGSSRRCRKTGSSRGPLRFASR